MYFNDQKKGFVPDPAKVEEMSRRPECRPAEADPEGNWGVPLDGFQISVRLPKNTFEPDETIIVEMVVRNVTNRDLTYTVLVPDKYLKIEVRRGDKFVVSKREAQGNDSFAKRLTSVVKDAIPGLLFAGTQHVFSFRLNDFYDLSDPGEYAVRVGRLVPGDKSGTTQECMSRWTLLEIKATKQR